jgi:hypothetical protein
LAALESSSVNFILVLRLKKLTSPWHGRCL